MSTLSPNTITTIKALLPLYGVEGTKKQMMIKSKKGYNAASVTLRLACEQDKEIQSLCEQKPIEVKKEDTVNTSYKPLPNAAEVLDRETVKNLKQDADNWQNFINNKFDPFDNYFVNLKVPGYTNLTKNTVANVSKNGRTFVTCCFDWHMGSRCDAEHSMDGQTWSSDECDKSIDKYADEIAKTAKNDKAGFEKCIIMWGGDLYHTFTGETAKGTILATEIVGEVQFDRIYFAMIRFVNKMLDIFGKVECHYVKGNHGGITDYGLGMALKNYYKELGEKCVWFINKNEMTYFTLQNSVIVLTHGASAESKGKFSASRSGHNEQVGHRIFNQIMEEENRIFPYKYVFVGDKHHYRNEECNGFELIQVGSMVKADKYASSMYFASRPSQLTCIFDEKGCVSKTQVFFD